MSKGKMKAKTNTAQARRNASAASKARKNTAKHSVFLFWFTAVALLVLFVGRWVVAIQNGYFSAFVELDASAATAVSNMTGRAPSVDDAMPLLIEWDLFTSSRLRDEVTTASEDGTELHAYLYNEGADVTVVVLPKFYDDGTADFMAGPYLNGLTGCNILLPDPRAHGESGGAYFTYGVKEKTDLAAWLDWADAALGPQTFILWGEGTGANTALMAAADGLLPDSVAFIVAESPYDSLHTMAKESIWKWYSVPSFPFLNAIEGKLARSGAGFRAVDIEMTPLLTGSGADIPVLFLISENDAYILPERSLAVSEAYPGPMEVVTAAGSHGGVYPAAQGQIEDTLSRWWGMYRS